VRAGSVSIRDAEVEELHSLSDLAFRSKASWGYDDAFMRACREELTITPDDLRRAVVRVASDDDSLVGVAALRVAAADAELTMLFVAPHAMRRGIGRALLRDAVEIAAASGATRVHIEADPNAVAFYERAGARRVGAVASHSIPGRDLPLLALDVP
jgi:ribosomal protein S18 acetylase RimI-like enzyme